MSYDTLLTDFTDGVFTLTLDRPDRLNAFSLDLVREYLDVLDEVDANDEIRVLIVTGAGRGFCAGADLGGGAKTFETPETPSSGGKATPRVPRDWGGLVSLRIYRCLKPVIAAINGPAVGVGITHALPMDIRLASEKAKFGFVFARRGIVPEACSSWFLPRVVGISKAMEWVATGRVFGAEEALAARLVSEVLAPDALLPRALEIAREIVDNTSAVSVALSRQMLWSMLGASHPMAAHIVDSQGIDYMGARADAREGVKSFLEKRPAEFTLGVSSDMPDFYPWQEDPEFEVP